ncbi:MAG: hypothetical protein ACR2OA_20230 [Rubripirellula sp.]|jgi:hypothetical protein
MSSKHWVSNTSCPSVKTSTFERSPSPPAGVKLSGKQNQETFANAAGRVLIDLGDTTRLKWCKR